MQTPLWLSPNAVVQSLTTGHDQHVGSHAALEETAIFSSAVSGNLLLSSFLFERGPLWSGKAQLRCGLRCLSGQNVCTFDSEIATLAVVRAAPRHLLVF